MAERAGVRAHIGGDLGVTSVTTPCLPGVFEFPSVTRSVTEAYTVRPSVTENLQMADSDKAMEAASGRSDPLFATYTIWRCAIGGLILSPSAATSATWLENSECKSACLLHRAKAEAAT